MQALDEAQLVGHGLQVREEVADPQAVLAADLAILEGWRAGIAALAAGHAREALGALDGGREVLARHLLEHRLVVEQVDVRQAAGLEETEHALGLGGEVRQAGQAGDALAGCPGRAEKLGEEHRAQGQAADAAGGLSEERPTGEVVGVFRARVHGISCG